MRFIKNLIKKALVLGLTFLSSPCFSDVPHISLNQLTPISTKTLGHAPVIEASGIVYLQGEGAENYLVISDETKGKYARLYGMNNKADIVSSLRIDLKGKIDDLESISSQGDSLIACSSASATNHGKVFKKRRGCHRLLRQDNKLNVEARFDLMDAFKHAAKKSTDKPTRTFLRKVLKKNTQDIEAHALYQNEFLVGFKSPRDKGETIILSLGSADKLFNKKFPQAYIWNRIDFEKAESKNQKFWLTDMTFLSSNELILTTRGKSISALWRFSVDSQTLEKLVTFAHSRAEGVAINKQTNEAIVVFDGGNQKGSFTYNVALP